MFSWIELAILLLQLTNKLVNWLHDRGMIDEGRRQVIAEYGLKIAAKVEARDKIRKRVDAMDEAEVDKELGDLEPPDGGGSKPMHS
jgi:hypothetical protein